MPDAAASDTSLNLNPKAKDQALAPHEVDLFQRALASPLQSIPKEFETWLVDRIAVLLPLIPIGQIVGFTQFTLQTATPVGTSLQTTTSTTYTNLSSSGPELTGLPNGRYALFFGALSNVTSAGHVAYMAPSVNGSTPSDDESAQSAVVSTAAAGVSRMVEVVLDGDGNNTVTMKYRSSIGSSSAGFNYRWLSALRIANA